ncbi:MAG: LysR family transcriptional regulator, partial [Acidimicrobiaceae bacterium]|nr:LysR family transcriptional regulator [Acidimicrobiaceae bacterium]
MDLRQLQALVAIADTGSFSGAASSLHTVQSNVSSHIARLERELGAQLVDRHGGTLTEEGVAVVERSRRIAGELDALVADVAALRDETIGSVRMGMIGTTARWLAPLLLDRLRVSHPKVRLVIGDGTSNTLELQLMSGTSDAAIVNLPHGTAELAARALFDEDLILVIPSEHPLATRDKVVMADLDGLELLMPAPGTTLRNEIDEGCRAAGVTLHPVAEFDGVRLIASLTYRGYGPAILPATGAAEVGEGYARIPV